MSPRALALGITGVLPGWLSSALIALFFLSVWVAPEGYGWDGMAGLRAIVLIEAVSVYGLLMMFGDEKNRMAWLAALPLALVLALWVGYTHHAWLGIALGLHLVLRTAGVWVDLQRARVATVELLLSLGLMLLAWFVVGLVWMPALGWTAEAVPPGLWWEVPTLAGATARRSYALPAWGFLYFSMLAVADAYRVAAGLGRRGRTGPPGS